MKCRSCGHDNRDGAKFCEQCGHTLTAPQVGGEHKQVTVLFADIQNSMHLAERVGAEEWHKVLDRFFHILNDGVHRYAGTVNQYTGDGIMALFGAPIAHEDHAQRACLAALHLRDRLRAFGEELGRWRGLDFAVRMGLNSGEVVVGTIGDDARTDYTAQGHTVGLAQRVEQVAGPNSACIAQATAALVADYFELRDLGEFSLKGVGDPVRVYELERVRRERTRIDVVLARSGTRLVGRRGELARLEQVLGEASSGHGRVVGVVGEPGVGKTRLCLELVRQCRARGAVLAQAHCPAHAVNIAWLPILELLRSLFDIRPGEDPDASRHKIRAALLKLGRSFNDSLPFAYDLLEVPDAQRPVALLEEERRARLVSFLRHLVQAQSAAAPLVLLIDDVHCIDADGDALLGEIVDALGWTRTLLLVNFRSGYRSAWMSAPYYEELSLDALADGEVDALLRRLVGDDVSTADLRRLIRERTGGNPFFVEEVVQSLVEHGVLARPDATEGAPRQPVKRTAMRLMRPIDDLSIPATIQAQLTARFDRLRRDDKLVLQAAAVIGRSFSIDVLRHVLATQSAPDTESEEVSGETIETALTTLVEADFIRRQAGEADGEYAFKHPLTQAVAYSSQLADARARLHVAVAQALQTLHADRLGQYASLLAHHFAAAKWKFEAARWRRRAALRVTSIELSRHRR